MRRTLLAGALFLITCAGLITSSATAQAPDYPSQWEIISKKSSVGFEAEQMGAKFEGTLGGISGEILFSPGNLPLSEVEVTVEVGAVASGDHERDRYLRGPEWLDTGRFPRAKFASTEFSHLGGNRYRASGDLSIRGVTHPAQFDFEFTTMKTLDGLDEVGIAEGEIVIDRLDFGVGQGQWTDSDTVGRTVTIRVRIEAYENAFAP